MASILRDLAPAASRVHPRVLPNRSVTPLARGCLDIGGEVVPYEQPSTVHVRSSCRRDMPVILGESTTVSELADEIRRRALLAPTQGIDLSYNGVALDSGKLSRYHVGSTIEMTIFKQNADPTRSLEQIRLTCPLLRTRLIPVEPDTTVQQLQQKVELQLQKGPHEWYNAQGEQLVCEGATLLANATVEANESQGTSALRQGEELVAVAGANPAAKKGTVSVRRAESGALAVILKEQATPLVPPLEDQMLVWDGLPLRDPTACLWELGVRTDDHLCLAFTSPVEPALLKLVRTPGPDKKAKGGGKKGKAKGGKAKGKKK